MADALETPLQIAPTYNEEALRLLSMAQNGVASIEREEDGEGRLIGFLSRYSIDLTGYVSPAQSVASLAQALVSAATGACAEVSQQVIPDETHRTAYTNAATIVWGNGGQAPSSGPAASAFDAQAAALGLSPATFASVVQAVSLVSLQLGAALSTLRGACSSANAAADLAAALSTFEGALSGIVSALNGAGLTISVTSPTPITIAGINA